MRVNKNANRRGATMVEFAMVFLIFMTLTIALIEGGRMVWVYTTLSHASRQGARFAMVHGKQNPVNDSEIAKVVHSNAVGLDSKNVTVKTTWNPDKSRGSSVEVKVAHDLAFVTAKIFFKASQIRLGSTSRMTVLN